MGEVASRFTVGTMLPRSDRPIITPAATLSAPLDSLELLEQATAGGWGAVTLDVRTTRDGAPVVRTTPRVVFDGLQTPVQFLTLDELSGSARRFIELGTALAHIREAGMTAHLRVHARSEPHEYRRNHVPAEAGIVEEALHVLGDGNVIASTASAISLRAMERRAGALNAEVALGYDIPKSSPRSTVGLGVIEGKGRAVSRLLRLPGNPQFVRVPALYCSNFLADLCETRGIGLMVYDFPSLRVLNRWCRDPRVSWLETDKPVLARELTSLV